MTSGEGLIEIELEHFYKWLSQWHPNGLEMAYGLPRINKANGTLEVDIAFSTDGHPSEWAKKPAAVLQMEELK